MSLLKNDPEIAEIIAKELDRQRYGLELIASENYTSKEVMEAQGSILTNKYAEGYPAKRYYGGCEFVDQSEQLAIDRAKKLFGADHCNVQPHSGSQANMAAYLALASPGDRLLGMDLSHGGHLTHGASVNFSGSLFQAFHYGIDPETHRINYETLRNKAKEVRPKILIAGFSAYPRELDYSKLRSIADEVEAFLVMDMAHIAGLVAGGVAANPIPHCHIVTTTTHKTLRGPRGGLIFCKEEFAKKVNSKIFPGIQGGPLQHVIAAKAVALGEALKPEFKTYAQSVVTNAKHLGSALLSEGFELVTGGTDNHLLLLDLTKRGITGKDAEHALEQAGITANKNTVPNEQRSPFVTSGIRLGTPALTSRGMGTKEMELIAKWIGEVLSDFENGSIQKEVRKRVKVLCEEFPIY